MTNSMLERLIHDEIQQQTGRMNLRKFSLLEFPMQVLALEHLQMLDLSADVVVNNKSITLSEEYWWEVSFDNNLIPVVPDAIRLLDKLEVLKLNQVSLELLSDRIGDLTQLRELHLRNNLLVSIPSSIGKLKNLEVLDVSFNKLKSIPPELGNCERLRVLNIGSNDLKTLPPEIGNLQNLRELDFSNYDEEQVWSDTVERFDLKANRIKKLPPETGKLDKLEVFLYEGNPLTEPEIWFLDDGYLPSAWFKKL